ncbi:hypothetical protein BsWGS_27514 [Bradybaena similaris]
MNRRKVPPEMASVVHSGWMTKSPPERQLRTHFKIFHAHWKKRFFVLRKPNGSLPDQYELHYYKDQRCTNKKGSIDLDQCEQIIEALDSNVFPHLLAIKTSYKNKVRTYYLATDTEQDMNTWVQWLCLVCGLRPEDQPTDIPDLKPDQSPAAGGKKNSVVVNGSTSSLAHQVKPTDSPMSTNPRVSAGHLARTHSRASTSSETSIGLFSAGSRVTGLHQSAGRKASVESASEAVAPPLPEKKHLLHINGAPSMDDDVFVPSLYDHPPSHRTMEIPAAQRTAEHSSKPKESGSAYKSPPFLTTRDNKLSIGETSRSSLADESTSIGRSPHTSLSSSLDSWTSYGITGQTATSTEGYDYPLSTHGLSTSSDNEIPPERPPKPHHLQSPYQNLPPTGKVTDLNIVPALTKSHQSNSVPGYDIPRSSQRLMQLHQTELSHVPVAPLKPGLQASSNYSSHTYLNTMTKSSSGEHPGGSRGGSDEDYSIHHAETGVSAPAVPPPRVGYLGESPTGHSGSLSLHQCPPSPSASSSVMGNTVRSAGRTLSHGPAVSSRTHNGHSVGQTQDEPTTTIFSTKRTRSFKSPYSLKSNVVKHSPKVNAVSLSATIPAPRPLLPPRPKEMSTSEDDEEMRAHEPEEETHHPLSLLRSIPAPSSQTEKELKYIDLAPPEANPDPPRFTHSHSHSHSRTDHSKELPTEYREIDFVKTQALNDTKRVKDKERKNDDQA